MGFNSGLKGLSKLYHSHRQDLTNTIEQNPRWEPCAFLTQNFPRIFVEAESSFPHSQQPAIFPYPEPDQSTPCRYPTS